jgi:hypothetical protein
MCVSVRVPSSLDWSRIGLGIGRLGSIRLDLLIGRRNFRSSFKGMLISDSVLTTADFPAVPAKTPPMATSPPTSVPLNVPRLPPYALSTEQSTVTVISVAV